MCVNLEVIEQEIWRVWQLVTSVPTLARQPDITAQVSVYQSFQNLSNFHFLLAELHHSIPVPFQKVLTLHQCAC